MNFRCLVGQVYGNLEVADLFALAVYPSVITDKARTLLLDQRREALLGVLRDSTTENASVRNILLGRKIRFGDDLNRFGD